MKNFWAIFDLDGTLCDASHRQSYAHAKNWDAFHVRCAEDPPHLAEVLLARAWVAAGGKIAYNTGRTEPFRALTQLWLRSQQLPDGPLFMRRETDRRPTTVAKREALMLIEALVDPGEQVAFIMEDKNSLVELWRSLGYTCFQPRQSLY